ncbi:DUF1819 family protein [Methanospirillum purgamenti]|uniref:DUF1819 family protein n=1 Tax=Methanospirillum hungatei TaxID=2203 RepID=A0A8F5VRD5_METHU|nr:BrxA family protein [Methanospirillum hungatei]QXO96048.1 DUF1819 family protein [Methanospirillum hungatei]
MERNITNNLLSSPYRDETPHCARHQIGALIHENWLVFSALYEGLSIKEVRQKASDGILFPQKARTTRERFWEVIQYRYLSRPEWVIADICSAAKLGERDSDFLQMLQIHYILRDSLTSRLIQDYIWNRWENQDLQISKADLMVAIQHFGVGHTRIERLTENSLNLLAQMILTSLRDFGLFEGKVKKSLVKPIVSLQVVSHLLRILIQEGYGGDTIINNPTWRMFLMTPEDVSHQLHLLSQQGTIQFERTGTTSILITPKSWLEG